MLADAKQRFLFEIRPDLFPDGYLTHVEELLWARFFNEKSERQGKS